LYPWVFHARPYSAGPFAVLFASWPWYLNRWVIRDLFINVLLYVPLGVTGYLAAAQRLGKAASHILPVLLGLILSTAIEVIQQFDAGRTSSLFDIACNVAGTAAGVVIASAFSKQIRSALDRHTHWRPDSRALLLLLLWVVVQMYPLFPSLSTYY